MKKFVSILLILWTVAVYAQDPRERVYNYEILQPSHDPKPKVEGFATQRISEKLNRGVVASATDKGVYVNWRLLASDPADVAFDVYKKTGTGAFQKINTQPISATTDFFDKSKARSGVKYKVIASNGEESEESAVVPKKKGEALAYRSVPLHDSLIAGRVGVGDLNGDGAYDFVILHPASNKDPSFRADSNKITYKIEAYLNDGTFLWKNDLGDGIEPGVWYSPFVIYDLNGDGKAEIAVKTAPTGIRNVNGTVTTGPEWISIWDGMTGKELARADWIERGPRFGEYNRNNRQQLGVAYLDGKTPCLLVARGTYRCMIVDAYQFMPDNKLVKLWRWDGDEENPVVRSQGAHGMAIADVDGDGRDEVILGSAVLDDDGTLLWCAGLGHPDKVNVTDIDPSRPGMEVFYACEITNENGQGVSMRDAKTGAAIWGIGKTTLHVGDGMVADIDPSRPGLECFATEDPKGGSSEKYLLDSKGVQFGSGDDVPPCRLWVWWDADLLREYVRMDGDRQRPVFKTYVSKYKGSDVASGIEGRVVLTGDILGDWREEIVTSLPGELRIYTTPVPAADRRVTLVQDNTYRQRITTHTMGYQQSPVPSYYLGEK